jgi:hypothetical protein
MNAGDNAFEAALQVDLRGCALLTALPIIGMIPMALGLGTAASRMLRWGARSSAACYSPLPRPYFSCRPYSIIHGRTSTHPIYSVEIPMVIST